MRQMTSIISGLLFSGILIFASCKKGETGPAGPAGPAGPQGPAGSQGAKGDTGAANVIFSNWLDVTFRADTVHLPGGGIDTFGFFAVIPATKLTNTILNTGEIKVYVNAGTPTTPVVYPIPYFDAIFSGLSIEASFRLQNIDLYSNANASTYVSSGAKRLQYRYILIPGAIPGQPAPNIDWNNYNEVQQYLDLRN